MGYDQAIRNQYIILDVIFKNGVAQNIDPDGWDPTNGTEPVLEIIDSYNTPHVTLSGNELTRVEAGIFKYNFLVPAEASLGLWKARWSGRVDTVLMQEEDLFNVTDSLSLYQIELVDRIKKELKNLTAQLEEADYPDIIVDAQADVRLLPLNGLAGCNNWEILWLTKRGIRHSLQRILNNWITLFSMSKTGKSLSLGEVQSAIQSRISQIDKQWEEERKRHRWDGEHWIDKELEVQPSSKRANYSYQVDDLTGEDNTEYAPEDEPPRRNRNYDDTFRY